MKREIDPENTSRGMAFNAWMSSTMPMVTIFKTIDITRLVRVSHKRHLSLNMLLCYSIGKAAMRVQEFLTLPENGKLMQYDGLGINIIIKNHKGGLSFLDIPVTADLEAFNQSYMELTRRVAETCENIGRDDQLMVIGTSALPAFDIDGVVNQYNARCNNPFLVWGRYRSRWFRKYLKLSFQFHHVQMDGEQACTFLDYLQEEVDKHANWK